MKRGGRCLSSIDGHHIEKDAADDSDCRCLLYRHPAPALFGIPICNPHIATVRREKAQLDDLGKHEVLFFPSSTEGVAAFHNDLPFDAVGDNEKRYYRQFGVESSRECCQSGHIQAALVSNLRGNFGLKTTGGLLGLPPNS